MADLATLRSLRERVIAATGADREIDGDIARFEGWTLEKMKGDAHPYWRLPGETRYFMRQTKGPPPYTASLDAAVALVERVLPGWSWSVERASPDDLAVACLTESEADAIDYTLDGRTPPLALLAALLAALIARAEEPSDAD